MTGFGDRKRAEGLLRLLAPGSSDSRALVIPGEPATGSWPRFANGRVYKLERDEQAEEATARYLRQRFRRPLTGNVAIGCVFFRSDLQLVTADDMLKHVFAAAKGVAWVDNSQVTAVYGQVELDADLPRTLIVIAPHVSTLARGTDQDRFCDGCGRKFRPSRLVQKCCSRDCTATVRGVKAGRS